MFEVSQFNQAEFQQFLIWKVQQRLSGTSVMPVDEIEGIRLSIQFVLDHAIEGNTIEERFTNGKEMLLEKLQETTIFYQQLKDTSYRYGIESITDTLDELGAFFDTYDLDYNATVSGGAFIDYQLTNPVDDQQYQGIDFVQQYLLRLSEENKFIVKIPPNQVQELLQAYRRKLGFDYRKDINNLYQVIFNQWIAKEIAGSPARSLLLTEPEAEFVFSSVRQRKIPRELIQLLHTQPYHQQTFQRFIHRIFSLDEAASIKNVLLLKEKQQPELSLIPSMPGNEFVQLLETVNTLNNQQAQVNYLLEEIVSPYDLLEFLEQEVVSRECCLQLFEKLSFELGLGVLLLVNQYQEGMLESWEEVLQTEEEGIAIQGIKRFIQRISPQQRAIVTATLQQVTIGERDFS